MKNVGLYLERYSHDAVDLQRKMFAMQSQVEHKNFFMGSNSISCTKINFYLRYLKFKVETFVNILSLMDADVSVFELSCIENFLIR